jgi:1,4-alpha-glucan branching enzyme
MPVTVDLLERKRTAFVLWRPNADTTPPQLVIGQFQFGNPNQLINQQMIPLAPVGGISGLWSKPAGACGLQDGQVYHYWFAVKDTNPDRNPPQTFQISDPAAFMVDWRLLAPKLTNPYNDDDRQPASVIKFKNGQLVACDANGDEPVFVGEPTPDMLPTNRQLVIYELPTAWACQAPEERDVGSFRDVLALIVKSAGGANFADSAITQPGRAYLIDLGINALELLPPADSFSKRQWGYDPSHYLAPDWELGFPDGNAFPTPNSDLAKLVNACHQAGIRFFIDVVLAFSRNEPYSHADFNDFCIEFDPKNPPANPTDVYTSQRANGRQAPRDGFGSTLFRYSTFINSYDPISGAANVSLSPGQRHMLTYLTRWMRDFHVDGVRIDSVENVANWDFLSAFKTLAYQHWNQRWADSGLAASAAANDRFIVVGEELTLPPALLSQNRVDGLWNEKFQSRIRAAVLGQNSSDEPTFEWTVRQAIDCRILGLSGTQAVNYVTKHDVEGFRHERLYNMLASAGLGQADIAKRVKLAFVCLLTSVGIPMFLAGEEFADQHDLFDAKGNVTQGGGKQVDPVNYNRAEEPFRKDILNYVSTLVKFRTTCPALAVDDTTFIQVDFGEGKRVLAWQRGSAGQDPVVVVANFSDYGTPNPFSPGAQYAVANWPATPAGRQWKEVTQGRLVLPNQIGSEPIFPWEAKVYTLV